jgi:hypothetical protein
MKLKFMYDSKEAIPAEYLGLFDEKDGRFILTGIEGVTSQSDLDKLQGALHNERDAHKQTKAELTKQLAELKAKFAELEKAGSKDPEPQPTAGATTDPTVLALKKELEKQQSALDEMQKKSEALEAEKKQLTILNSLKRQAEGKIRAEAMGDLELYAGTFELTDDGKIVTKDGTPVEDWFSETLKSKPHWLPENTPSGAKGGQGTGKELSLDAKRAKLNEFAKKDTLTPLELSAAHKLASEVKMEQAKATA